MTPPHFDKGAGAAVMVDANTAILVARREEENIVADYWELILVCNK